MFIKNRKYGRIDAVNDAANDAVNNVGTNDGTKRYNYQVKKRVWWYGYRKSSFPNLNNSS